ncbi:MAG: hypothetical protein KDB01_12185 [Planctomycetaceae bacterium]|nr:hypothetical protein [Planctomycetaceae bacterium]
MIYSLDLNKRRDQTRKLLARILEEQVYIAFSSELGLQCHGRLAGLTAVGLSALVRESMPEQYVGPLPAIAVVDDDLRSGKYQPDGAAMLFDSIVLHEASHIVTSAVTAEICPEDDNEELRALVQVPWREWQSHAGAILWTGHDWRFIRALCHIGHRMRSRGHWVSLDLAFCHETYGLSSAEEYAAALDDECCAMSWLPLSEALGRPMPAKFQKLWTDDVVRSLSSVPMKRQMR